MSTRSCVLIFLLSSHSRPSFLLQILTKNLLSAGLGPEGIERDTSVISWKPWSGQLSIHSPSWGVRGCYRAGWVGVSKTVHPDHECSRRLPGGGNMKPQLEWVTDRDNLADLSRGERKAVKAERRACLHSYSLPSQRLDNASQQEVLIHF